MGEESPKARWVEDLPHGEPLEDELARLVDAERDDAEVAYYEAASDPTFVLVERQRRHYRGMIRRRLRRRPDPRPPDR